MRRRVSASTSAARSVADPTSMGMTKNATDVSWPNSVRDHVLIP